MQGEWVRLAGGAYPKWARFVGNTLYLDYGAESSRRYTFTLNGPASPKSLDIRAASGADVMKCIYVIENGTLTLSYNGWGDDRPTAFDGPGAGRSRLIFKRKSP
jgi:uncharacterized protein (TIGR03067 family)